MSNSTHSGFESFCDDRLVPIEMRNDFIRFFRKIFSMHLSEKDDDVLNEMIIKLSHNEVEKYWIKYIQKIRNENIGG